MDLRRNVSSPSRHALRVGALLLLVGLVAAACGGSQETPQEKWAAGFCGALLTWQESISASASTLRDGGNLSANDARDAVTSAVDATRTLGTSLQELGPPETSSGNEIDTQVRKLQEGIAKDGETLSAQVGSDASGIAATVAKFTAIAGTLGDMVTKLRAAIDVVRTTDPAGDLRTALDANKDCTTLRG